MESSLINPLWLVILCPGLDVSSSIFLHFYIRLKCVIKKDIVFLKKKTAEHISQQPNEL